MEELKKIEIAIDLDKGEKISEISKKFNVSKNFVKSIAKKMFSEEIKITKKRKRIFSESEREILLERVENGESLEVISLESGVSENTLRRWCKKYGKNIPRKLEKIKKSERLEISEMLEVKDWQEVAKAYNVSRETIEELKSAAHSILDVDTLSYLFELIREKPTGTSKSLCRIMRGFGFDIKEIEVLSYKRRLKSLNLI